MNNITYNERASRLIKDYIRDKYLGEVPLEIQETELVNLDFYDTLVRDIVDNYQVKGAKARVLNNLEEISEADYLRYYGTISNSLARGNFENIDRNALDTAIWLLENQSYKEIIEWIEEERTITTIEKKVALSILDYFENPRYFEKEYIHETATEVYGKEGSEDLRNIVFNHLQEVGEVYSQLEEAEWGQSDEPSNNDHYLNYDIAEGKWKKILETVKTYYVDKFINYSVSELKAVVSKADLSEEEYLSYYGKLDKGE